MRMLINEIGLAVIEDDNYHTKWVVQNNKLAHDNFLLPIIQPYLKRYAVDIGAHIGTHSVFYAEHSERVLSFEPHPVVFQCLQYNIKHLKNVIALNYAISDKKQSLSLIEHSYNAGATQTRKAETTNIACNAYPLDMFQLKECDFIKIDAEGDEVPILQGATQTILHHKPVMVIECNEYALRDKGFTSNDLKQTIHDLGYTYNMVHPRQDPKHCDLLCLPGRATT